MQNSELKLFAPLTDQQVFDCGFERACFLAAVIDSGGTLEISKQAFDEAMTYAHRFGLVSYDEANDRIGNMNITLRVKAA